MKLQFASKIYVSAEDLPGIRVGHVSPREAEDLLRLGAKVQAVRRSVIRSILLPSGMRLDALPKGEEHLMNAPHTFRDQPLRPPIGRK